MGRGVCGVAVCGEVLVMRLVIEMALMVGVVVVVGVIWHKTVMHYICGKR